MEKGPQWKLDIEEASNIDRDRPSHLAGVKGKRQSALPLDATKYSSVFKVAYEASEPIIFDDSIPLPFAELTDRMVQCKYPPKTADERLEDSRSLFDESCIHEDGLVRHEKTHAIPLLSQKIMAAQPTLKHNYAMHNFLTNTDDPFTGLRRDRLPDEDLLAHQGLLPDRRIHSSMMLKSTASSTQETGQASQDLLALTSDIESLATESQATSEGERWLDSSYRIVEHEI